MIVYSLNAIDSKKMRLKIKSKIKSKIKLRLE